MSLFKKPFNSQETIARTGFFACAISFLVFLCAEAVRPGFASNYFSVHWFLFGAVLFGLWWMRVRTEGPDRKTLQYAAAIALCLVFAVAAWNLGQGLKEYRILVALLSLFVPFILLRLLRSE